MLDLLFDSISLHCFSHFKHITRYPRGIKTKNKKYGNMLPNNNVEHITIPYKKFVEIVTFC